MLYVTTRGGDAFTAFRALSESRGPEGGFFVPLRLPCFDTEQIGSMGRHGNESNDYTGRGKGNSLSSTV